MSTTLSFAPDARPAAEIPLAQLLYADFDAELAATRRLLERFPDGRGEWRPHERSRTLAELATHLSDLAGRCAVVLTTRERDALGSASRPPLASADALLAAHDAGVARLREALAAADHETLAVEWTIRRGERVMARGPRRVMLRVMMSHMVHHRAQLGVCYRLLDVPVPGVYGPSADDLAAGGAA
ncbi:MAG TPA: DinB family protein [Longimicrobium sp.]